MKRIFNDCNIREKVKYMFFTSDVNPVKFMVAFASLLFGFNMFGTESNVGLAAIIGSGVFSAAMFLYGVGLLWRIADSKHRRGTSTSLAVFGTLLWTATAWQEYYENIRLNTCGHNDVASVSAVAAAACWLLVRCGSGELIASDKNCKQ